MNELEKIQKEILGKIRKNRNFYQTRSDYSRDKPEIKINYK